jgi:hypothetical protein
MPSRKLRAAEAQSYSSWRDLFQPLLAFFRAGKPEDRPLASAGAFTPGVPGAVRSLRFSICN